MTGESDGRRTSVSSVTSPSVNNNTPASARRLSAATSGTTAKPTTAATAAATTTTTQAATAAAATTGTPGTAVVSVKREQCLSVKIKKSILGTILSIMTSVTLVATSQLVNVGLRPQIFDAPFFFVYVSTIFLIPLYPAYMGLSLLVARGGTTAKKLFCDDISVLGQATSIKSRLVRVLLITLVFTLFWDLTYYMLFRTLGAVSVSSVLSMLGCLPVFSYLMSWMVLHIEFVALRVIASIFTLSGAVLMTYKNGIGEDTPMWWLILAIFASGGMATFRVVAKRTVSLATCGQTALFLSSIGLFHTLTMWPIFLILLFSRAEPISWSLLPTDYLMGGAVSFNVLEFFLHFGPLVTYEQFVEFAVMLAIPLSVGYDLLYNDLVLSNMAVAGMTFIILGYLILLLPSDWDHKVRGVIRIGGRGEKVKDRVTSPRLRLRPRKT